MVQTRKLVDDEPFLYATKGTLTDDNDELQRSPGTPIFTIPECCLGEDQFSYIIPIPDSLGLLIDDILQHTFTLASGGFHLQMFMFCLILYLQLTLEFFYDSRVMDVVVHATL
ncbi:hypothetical protein GIB67_025478 [Kingdonia uniflora]|uniref:Uncharacterized protein n=1 Tax=Kingdonia uniflora TaxID=39325 RepID=A0A7J7PCF8_9MAGN|nr:hypothetical protein GIB67_025478 [Kingdonia uniflora]